MNKNRVAFILFMCFLLIPLCSCSDSNESIPNVSISSQTVNSLEMEYILECLTNGAKLENCLNHESTFYGKVGKIETNYISLEPLSDVKMVKGSKGVSINFYLPNQELIKLSVDDLIAVKGVFSEIGTSDSGFPYIAFNNGELLEFSEFKTYAENYIEDNFTKNTFTDIFTETDPFLIYEKSVLKIYFNTHYEEYENLNTIEKTSEYIEGEWRRVTISGTSETYVFQSDRLGEDNWNIKNGCFVIGKYFDKEDIDTLGDVPGSASNTLYKYDENICLSVFLGEITSIYIRK